MHMGAVAAYIRLGENVAEYCTAGIEHSLNGFSVWIYFGVCVLSHFLKQQNVYFIYMTMATSMASSKNRCVFM